MTALALQDHSITAFAELLDRKDLFDQWLSERAPDAAVGTRGRLRHSPIERWLSDNGFAVTVYEESSHTLAAACPTPRWAAQLLAELEASGDPGSVVFQSEVRLARRRFDRDLYLVNAEGTS